MSCGSEAKVEQLQDRVSQLERRLGQVEAFLNKAFNTSTQQGIQYNQPNDRSETGMGAIVGADRTSFI
jgi:hypothetical protein